MHFLQMIFATFLFGITTTASAQTPTSNEIDPLAYVLPKDKSEVFEIEWSDLLPPGEAERYAERKMQELQSLWDVEEGSEADIARQLGTHNAVTILDGHAIRLAGYAVPFEFGRNAMITEFLLVPYEGACLHAPPPPPNQTVYVKTSKPIRLKDLSKAIWAEGELNVTSTYTNLADAAYILNLTTLEKY